MTVLGAILNTDNERNCMVASSSNPEYPRALSAKFLPKLVQFFFWCSDERSCSGIFTQRSWCTLTGAVM